VALVPFLIVLITAQERAASFAAAAIFVVGAASDGLDGYIARRYATVSRTGQWLDPLADKILVLAPVLTLAFLGRFPLWAAVIVTVREVGIAVLRAVLGLRGRSMPAVPLAKVKTLLQLLAITLYILPLGAGLDLTKLTALVIALAVTLYTGVRYAVRAIPWLRAARAGTGDAG
jgi:CDP-diacylglycerol--glycerol-3-phosphate 3-phosphatidyltransferase